MAKEKSISSVRSADGSKKSSIVSSVNQSGSKKPASNPKPRRDLRRGRKRFLHPSPAAFGSLLGPSSCSRC
jgi:hypothetical protein